MSFNSSGIFFLLERIWKTTRRRGKIHSVQFPKSLSHALLLPRYPTIKYALKSRAKLWIQYWTTQKGKGLEIPFNGSKKGGENSKFRRGGQYTLCSLTSFEYNKMRNCGNIRVCDIFIPRRHILMQTRRVFSSSSSSPRGLRDDLLLQYANWCPLFMLLRRHTKTQHIFPFLQYSKNLTF